MSYRDALKVFKLERALNDDEMAFLNTLRKMTDTERELLVESLAPEKPVKKPATTRNVEHCVACNYTRRAIHHKDTSHTDYHEFQSPSGQKKSRRAASISEAIQGTAGGTVRTGSAGDNDDPSQKPERCAKCLQFADANVHHLRTDPNYHSFESSAVQAATGD